MSSLLSLQLSRSIFSVVASLFLNPSSFAKGADRFANKWDKPAKQQIIALAPDPINPDLKRSVTCSYYPNFIVKVVDYGEKSSAQLSILPREGDANSVCAEKNTPDEFVIEKWYGFFEGAKAGYAFFSADDGNLGGGMAFMVFRVRDRKTVFVDDAGYKDGRMQIKSVQMTKAGLILRYLRSFTASCSVVTAKETCLQDINKRTGVAKNFAAKCVRKYQLANEDMAKFQCEGKKSLDSNCIKNEMLRLVAQGNNTTPSFVSYDVEATIPDTASALDMNKQDTMHMRELASSYIKKKSDVIDCFPAQ